jgi:hypothetical protein
MNLASEVNQLRFGVLSNLGDYNRWFGFCEKYVCLFLTTDIYWHMVNMQYVRGGYDFCAYFVQRKKVSFFLSFIGYCFHLSLQKHFNICQINTATCQDERRKYIWEQST